MKNTWKKGRIYTFEEALALPVGTPIWTTWESVSTGVLRINGPGTIQFSRAPVPTSNGVIEVTTSIGHWEFFFGVDDLKTEVYNTRYHGHGCLYEAIKTRREYLVDLNQVRSLPEPFCTAEFITRDFESGLNIYKLWSRADELIAQVPFETVRALLQTEGLAKLMTDLA